MDLRSKLLNWMIPDCDWLVWEFLEPDWSFSLLVWQELKMLVLYDVFDYNLMVLFAMIFDHFQKIQLRRIITWMMMMVF